ncbi:MAG: YcaO-like family protein [Polyangiaceae bacterium]|nr:YcaO-like family protein [Polyangiaceae bacterium]
MAIRDQFGITRVAEVTGLDDLGMPVHSIFRPRSTSMASVHSGKGLTVIDSLASGLAEAIETDCGERFLPADRVEGCFRTLQSEGYPVVRFTEGVPGGGGVPEDVPLEWVWVDDLLADEGERRRLIPLEFVAQGKRRETWRLFDVRISNGLASGNVLEEALCHAIHEVVERDALGIFTFRAKYLDEDVRPSYRRVDLRTLPNACRALVEKVRASGRGLCLVDATTDLDIPVIFCAMTSDHGPCVGFGAHLDAEVAVLRAFTEAVQTSALNIQGSREDLGEREPRIYDHSQAFASRRGRQVAHDRTFPETRFSDIHSRSHEYVDQDLDDLLDCLRLRGVDRVYACEISDPSCRGFSVARVVIPALEDFRLDNVGRRRVRYGV